MCETNGQMLNWKLKKHSTPLITYVIIFKIMQDIWKALHFYLQKNHDLLVCMLYKILFDD